MRIVAGLLTALLAVADSRADFRAEQRRFPRVRGAYEHFETKVHAVFRESGIPFPPAQIYLRAFKRDRKLELWAAAADGAFRPVKTYPICALSGDLGPKWQEGDGQIPEGFYTIDGFNPTSSYHLSLRVNYPNEADRKRSTAKHLGSDIFVHGKCVTIGCLPLRDEGIEELYVIALETKAASGKPIRIDIFPTRMTEGNLRDLSVEYGSRPEILSFWKNLREGYELFERTKRPPTPRAEADGSYRF